MDIMSDGPVLVLSGDLDVRSTMQVRTAVQELLGTYDEVAIDLSGVESADVTALRVLAAATRPGDPRRPPPHAAPAVARRTPDAAPVAPGPGRRGRARRRAPAAMSDNPHADPVTNR